MFFSRATVDFNNTAIDYCICSILCLVKKRVQFVNKMRLGKNRYIFFQIWHNFNSAMHKVFRMSSFFFACYRIIVFGGFAIQCDQKLPQDAVTSAVALVWKKAFSTGWMLVNKINRCLNWVGLLYLLPYILFYAAHVVNCPYASRSLLSEKTLWNICFLRNYCNKLTFVVVMFYWISIYVDQETCLDMRRRPQFKWHVRGFRIWKHEIPSLIF